MHFVIFNSIKNKLLTLQRIRLHLNSSLFIALLRRCISILNYTLVVLVTSSVEKTAKLTQGPNNIYANGVV